MSQREELFERKRRAVELMDGGMSLEEANERSGLNYSQTGLYCLYREWKERGDEALVDHRHGHVYKAIPEVRDWMTKRCEDESEVRASQLVTEIDAEFGVELTPQYVTVLRRQLGLPVPRPGNPGKQKEKPVLRREPEVEARESAPETQPEGDFSPRIDETSAQRCDATGAYLMLGAAVESEAWSVLTNSLEQTIEDSKAGTKLRGTSTQTARERHLLTALAMPMLGLYKPYALDTYSGTVLGLLTGRGRPYSADEMDHFVLSCVRAGWSEPLTADAAGWATQLWASEDEQTADEPTYLYWDWHVKAVYSDYHVPRTKHGTMLRILGARKQLMLHDSAGHLLFMDTYRGDTHLIDGMITGTAYYEGLEKSRRLTHQIFDREGLSVAHFKNLLDDEDGKRLFTTCLKSNQYEGVASFELVGPFQTFRRDEKGRPVEEIAEATYEMKDRRTDEDDLPLRAILLRKPATSVVEGESSDEDEVDDDEVHLQVIVTPDQSATAAEVVERYRARQSKQENAIRDWWLPLGGDVNVGYDKQEVENSELAKVKTDLEERLERLKRYIPACEERLERAQRRHQKHLERYQAGLEKGERTLEKEFRRRDARDHSALAIHRWVEAEQARMREDLKPMYERVEAAAGKIEEEQEKQEKYNQEQQEKERELSKVSQEMKKHPMYELDDRKDQLMSALRIFLVNIFQWLRNTVFPKSYERATYETLAHFLQMGGFVVEHPDCIEVFLDGFWQSAKQRKLEELVARCNVRQFTAPDGRRLRFDICSKPGHI